MDFLYANVFNSICQLWGVTFFYQVSHVQQLDRDILGVTGVYIFIDYRRIPVYVGFAKNLNQRLKLSHKRYENDSIIVIECPADIDKALILESAFITSFQPERNRKRRIV